MSGAGIVISIDDNPVRRGLGRLAARLSDLYPVLDTIGASIAAETVQHFEAGASPDGNPWPVSLRARIQSGQTLVDTGRLVQSISHQVAADRQSVSVGTNVEYAAIHQFGGVIRPVRAKALKFRLPTGQWVHAQRVVMPARPYLGIGWGERETILDTIAHWLGLTEMEASTP